MGLCMTVGALAYLRENDPEGTEYLLRALKEVNRLLEKNGLPLHQEPESLPAFSSRSKLLGQPYSMLHYLRRAVAHALRGRNKLTPLSDGDDPFADPMYDSVLCGSESHVVCHSDCEGFYVPIDFPEPLYDYLKDGAKRCLEGGILGSSQGALRELVLTAPLLGIRLTKGKLADKEATAINKEKESDTPLWTERKMWLQFFEMARLSIEHKTAIHFH